jgi:predicted DNA-binding transcriptional regulator AlpA
VRLDSRTELVTASDIARRLGVSRQRVNQLQAQTGFPQPIGVLAKSNIWRWSSIERWAIDTDRVLPDVPADAQP